MTSKRDMLVTSALPYANGPLHLGNMLEFVQTDIWVRFQRMQGHQCLYVCGDDAHGTPIMLNAERQGITPEALIEKIHDEHKRDFADFDISVDNFYTTHSAENEELSQSFYNKLEANGDIVKRTIEQAYDPVKNMFLPDRYVKGTCPRCGATDQYGDNCEVCGATYSPADLIDPYSTLSNATPERKNSEHYFFDLPKYQEALKTWLQTSCKQPEIIHKLNEWFDAGLAQWDISRDAPYFGFQIPNTTDKYFYVWLDAPIGYMASTLNHARNINDEEIFTHYWHKDSNTELYHFVGKDIIYFHNLFWPATLMGADYRLPTSVFAHGFLTINGSKMSKSRGTFITARQYLENCDPQQLRYYFAAKLGSGVEDIDLTLDDFKARVNSDLVGKVVNIASRSAGFIHKHFDGRLSESIFETTLLNEFKAQSNAIANAYEQRHFSSAMRQIMQLADLVNQMIDEEKPWQMIKEDDKRDRVHQVCTLGLNAFRLLVLFLKPVLPKLAQDSEDFLNIEPLSWNDNQTNLLNHSINPFKPLMQRIQEDDLSKLVTGS